MDTRQLNRLLRSLLRYRGKRSTWWWLVVLGLVAWMGLQAIQDLSQRGGTGGAETAGAGTIIRAYQLRQSDLIVEAEATVLKHLRDDDEGSRHQKMLLKLPGSNHTLLLAHNIDLAPRVPAEEGDAIRFRGEYEFSDKGGVIHWTHHDPAGRHPGGWIDWKGTRFE